MHVCSCTCHDLWRSENIPFIVTSHHTTWLRESLFARPRSLGLFSCLRLSSHNRSTVITEVCSPVWLSMAAGDLNSGPHDCMVSALPTESSPLPYKVIFNNYSRLYRALRLISVGTQCHMNRIWTSWIWLWPSWFLKCMSPFRPVDKSATYLKFVQLGFFFLWKI